MSSPVSAGRDRAAAMKYRKYMRETGRPLFIQAGPVTRRISRKLAAFYEGGMSIPEMSRRAGVSYCTIHRLIYREDVGILRTTAQKLDALKFTAAEAGHIDPTGSIRRMGALWADGFPGTWLSDRLGVDQKHFFYMTHGHAEFVTVAMARRIERMYDDLAGRTPADFGIVGRSQNLAALYASRAGFAPRTCWDPDTIDDPDAHPEWTGSCGTVFGWRIHQRQGIPVCERCSAAHEGGRYVLSPGKLRDARIAQGLLLTDVQRLTGVNKATIQSWEAGRSKPSNPAVLEKVLTVLDVTFEDVSTQEEAET